MNIHTGFPRLWWRLAQAERQAASRALTRVGEPGPPKHYFRRPRWELEDRPRTFYESYALQGPYEWVSRNLAPVHRPPAEFYEPIHAWYRYQHRHAEWLHILGDRSCPRHAQWVRWQWPPKYGEPVHGWRAQLVARALIAMCRDRTHNWRLDWNVWDHLQHVAKGKRAFDATLLTNVEAEIVKARLWWEKKKRPFTVTVGAQGPQLGLRR